MNANIVKCSLPSGTLRGIYQTQRKSEESMNKLTAPVKRAEVNFGTEEHLAHANTDSRECFASRPQNKRKLRACE